MISNPNDKPFTLHGPFSKITKSVGKSLKQLKTAEGRASMQASIDKAAKTVPLIEFYNKRSSEVLDNADSQVPAAIKKEYPAYNNCLRADVRYYASFQLLQEADNRLTNTRWSILNRCKAARAAILGGVGKTDKAILEANLKDLRIHALWLMNLQGAPEIPFGTTKWAQGPLISGGGTISPLIPLSVLMPDALAADENPDVLRNKLNQRWTSLFLDDAMETQYIKANQPYNKFTYGVKQSGRPYSWPMQALYGKFQGWGPSASYNLNDVFKEGGDNPTQSKLSTSGVKIPNILPELGWHAFNLNQLKKPGDIYYPKMKGASGKAVKDAVKYGIDSGQMSAKGLDQASTYILHGSRTETFLMEIAAKMNEIEMILTPYNKMQAASDDKFFKEYLGQPFNVGMLLTLVQWGGGEGKATDISTLLSLMKKEGGGKLQKIGRLGESSNEQQQADLLFSDLQQGGVKITVKTTGGQVELLGLPQCKGLPAPVQAFLQCVALVETYAIFSNSQAGTALGLAMSIEDLADEIDDKTKLHTLMTEDWIELNAKYKECLKKQGKGFGSGTGEQSEICSKLKAELEALTDKRYEVAEEIAGLARTQGRQGNLRQDRNDTSQKTKNASLAPRYDTISVPLTGKDGLPVFKILEIGSSPEAKKAVIESGDKSVKAQKSADASHNKTFANLKKLGENLGLTGLGTLISTDEKIYKVIIPEFIVPLTTDPPEKKKKAGFPWLLLLAGAGAASGAIPIAAAAGVGALGIYMQSKAKKKEGI
jgi:hypothetical protein